MTRTVECRIKVLRNGAELTRLQAVSSPTIKMDAKGKIKSSLSGDFLNNSLVDWLRDELAPALIIDGVEHPCGIFLPSTVTPSEDATTSTLKIQAYDRCWRVQDTRSEGLLSLPAGNPYTTAIKTLLEGAGISLAIITPSTAVLSERREDWELGTDYLTIINQLLTEINYKELWFNAQGYAMIQPKAAPGSGPIQHTMDSRDADTLVLPGLSRQTDIFSRPNVFICICSNADKEAPLVATAENTNPQSPLSISRRGRRIAKIYKIDNIPDQNALQEYANQLRDSSMQLSETLSVSTGLRPGHGVGDTVALHYNDIHSLCTETGWQMSFQPGGAMRHTLERVVRNI